MTDDEPNVKELKNMGLYFSTCGDVWRPAEYMNPYQPSCWRCAIAEVTYSSKCTTYTLFDFIENISYQYESFKEMKLNTRKITNKLRNRTKYGSF